MFLNIGQTPPKGTIIKNSFYIKVLMFIFLGLIFLISSSQISLAQDEEQDKTSPSIEDYLNEPKSAQDNVVPINKEEPDESILSKFQKKIEDTVLSPDTENNSDALPQVNSPSTFDTNDLGGPVGTLPFNVQMQKTQQQMQEEIRREAFDAAMTGLFPLRPDQIKQLLEEYDSTKRIVKQPVHGIPKPEISVATVSLDPGVAPMIITTATGHVSTLNILDITGAPWPIQDVSWAGDFEIIEPEEGGHIIRITPMEQAAYGNMSIRLLTLKTPITIMLRTSPDEVQYRVDARVPEYGPFAQAPLIEGGSERVAGNALITSILDGTPPSGAVKMDVSGVDGRTSAYNIGGMTYVRTPLTLLSPGWEQSVSSADGMNVYALSQTPVLLLSDKGRFMRANLNTAKDLLDE